MPVDLDLGFAIISSQLGIAVFSSFPHAWYRRQHPSGREAVVSLVEGRLEVRVFQVVLVSRVVLVDVLEVDVVQACRKIRSKKSC